MSAHESRAATLLFRILENGHVKPDVHEQVWFAEAKRLLECPPAETTADSVCSECRRTKSPVDHCSPSSLDDDGQCPYLTIERLRSQAAEREALLARGVELLEQDSKEIERLRAELSATKREAEHRAWREGAHQGRQLPMNTWTELMDSNPYPDPKREPE